MTAPGSGPGRPGAPRPRFTTNLRGYDRDEVEAFAETTERIARLETELTDT